MAGGVTSLPRTPRILRDYATCDGGHLAWFTWPGIDGLPALNDLWFKMLEDYYPNRTGPLTRGRHTVLANDVAGAPLIWDAEAGTVATFYWKGGDWEPLAPSMEAFLDRMFNSEEEIPSWNEALTQLDQL